MRAGRRSTTQASRHSAARRRNSTRGLRSDLLSRGRAAPRRRPRPPASGGDRRSSRTRKARCSATCSLGRVSSTSGRARLKLAVRAELLHAIAAHHGPGARHGPPRRPVLDHVNQLDAVLGDAARRRRCPGDGCRRARALRSGAWGILDFSAGSLRGAPTSSRCCARRQGVIGLLGAAAWALASADARPAQSPASRRGRRVRGNRAPRRCTAGWPSGRWGSSLRSRRRALWSISSSTSGAGISPSTLQWAGIVGALGGIVVSRCDPTSWHTPQGSPPARALALAACGGVRPLRGSCSTRWADAVRPCAASAARGTSTVFALALALSTSVAIRSPQPTAPHDRSGGRLRDHGQRPLGLCDAEGLGRSRRRPERALPDRPYRPRAPRARRSRLDLSRRLGVRWRSRAPRSSPRADRASLDVERMLSTSPSATTYVFPSRRCVPRFAASAREPASSRSPAEMTSQRMKPRAMSERIVAAASSAVWPRGASTPASPSPRREERDQAERVLQPSHDLVERRRPVAELGGLLLGELGQLRLELAVDPARPVLDAISGFVVSGSSSAGAPPAGRRAPSGIQVREQLDQRLDFGALAASPDFASSDALAPALDVVAVGDEELELQGLQVVDGRAPSENPSSTARNASTWRRSRGAEARCRTSTTRTAAGSPSSRDELGEPVEAVVGDRCHADVGLVVTDAYAVILPRRGSAR